jgi:hypothetical protein
MGMEELRRLEYGGGGDRPGNTRRGDKIEKRKDEKFREREYVCVKLSLTA